MYKRKLLAMTAKVKLVLSSNNNKNHGEEGDLIITEKTK